MARFAGGPDLAGWVLVVDDEPTLRETVGYNLLRAGLEVELAEDGPMALAAARARPPDLVVLDVMLPGMDGFQVLRSLREESTVPVLLLSARGAEHDRVHGLELGADDYLTKPFNIDELVARMIAVLRRVEPEEMVRLGDLEVNIPARQVWRGGEEIALTSREFDVLEVLARNAWHVISRDTILDRVWDDQEIDPNIVDVYIGYLRKKIDAMRPTPLIRTVRGVGFTLRDE